MSKRMVVLMCSIFLIVPLLFMGCSGDNGSTGATGATGATGDTGATGATGKDLTATAKPESCSVCHNTAGNEHQASYDQLYQDNVIVVTDVAYTFNAADNTDEVSFNIIKKAGLNASTTDFDCTKLQNLNVYYTAYDNGDFTTPEAARRSLKGTIVNDGGGLCIVTKASLDNVDLSTTTGLIVVYGYDESTGGAYTANRVQQAKYPYAGLLNLGEGLVDYVSPANVAGCQKCHMTPYLKHGNIYGQVNHDPATDFYTCKACHLDNGAGSDFIWQILVDDPATAAVLEGLKVGNEIPYTPAQEAKYAYKTKLMNDVHMSHAMEFEYPQSMATCNTCHADKLDMILTADNFVAETCKSCHPVTDADQLSIKPQPSMTKIWADKGVSSFHNINQTCNTAECHGEPGGNGAAFSTIHTGYDPVIYASGGIKYSDIITVTIDNASIDNTNKLTFTSHAVMGESGIAVTSITPTVMVGLYGWDSKDYVVGPHETNADGKRNLEYLVGATHPRFTTDNTTPAGTWTVTADLSSWASKIADGTVKRVEIAVMPTLRNAAIADNQVLALNAPSRTFNLKKNAFENFFSPIVKVTDGCNNCHDALATTFHSGDRGGNIVVCRLCHTVRSGGSHLEMQSRSIDSYAHAIHSFQAFDIQTVDFADPVQEMFYNLKIESNYPTFGRNDCKSCHVAGTFNVPDQSKSLPGILSASRYPLINKTRAIGTVPSYVVGPASRACGACHRADMINEDAAVELASFNQHTGTNGYLLLSGTGTTVLDTATLTIMDYFVEGIVLPAP